jgi:peptidoglycan/xylan/chitin deacetylase (PgdA/CDA1 family)
MNFPYYIGLTMICYLLYCLVPTLYFRLNHHADAYLPSCEDKNIILTIDDGPDPVFTNAVLDILAEYGVKATFFVVAEKAALNGQIIQRMMSEGHEVALHSLAHKCAWLKGWKYIKKDFETSSLIMNRLGCKPRYYRPPWGLINFSSMRLTRKYGLKIMLWDVMVQDWRKSSTSLLILGRLFLKMKNNSIICLHDSSEGIGAAKNAPEQTIKALQTFIPSMIKEGYHFVLPHN